MKKVDSSVKVDRHDFATAKSCNDRELHRLASERKGDMCGARFS